MEPDQRSADGGRCTTPCDVVGGDVHVAPVQLVCSETLTFVLVADGFARVVVADGRASV